MRHALRHAPIVVDYVVTHRSSCYWIPTLGLIVDCVRIGSDQGRIRGRRGDKVTFLAAKDYWKTK